MSYYWLNRQELLPRAKVRYNNCGGKEKAAEYYLKNKNVIKEIANNKSKKFSDEEKEANKEYGKNRYKNIVKEKSC